MKRNPSLPVARLLACLWIFLLSAGCVAQPAAAPTAAPASTAVPSETPSPTATATMTATATATMTSTPDLAATKAARASAATAAASATAAAVVEATMKYAEPDLLLAEVIPEDGAVIWSSDRPISLTTDVYMGEDFYPLKKAGEIGDFVLKADITWDSSSGFAGCGINFRAEEDPLVGEHYTFLMMRLQFLPAFDVEHHKDGLFVTNLSGEPVFTNHLIDEKMSRNKVILVARGDQITVFLNGERERTVIGEKLTRGMVQLGVWQESGRTTCTFENAWIWVPNE